MKQTRLWAAAAIIACIILAGFAFSVPHTRDIIRELEPSVATSVPSVILHDAFKKGVHTITGSVQAPNACSVVSAEANLAGDASSTESIQVAVTLSSDTGVCLELPTTMNFTATIAAPAHLPLSATVNGSPATTTSS